MLIANNVAARLVNVDADLALCDATVAHSGQERGDCRRNAQGVPSRGSLLQNH